MWTLTLLFKGGAQSCLLLTQPKPALMFWVALLHSWFIESVTASLLPPIIGSLPPLLQRPKGSLLNINCCTRSLPSCISLVDFFYCECKPLYLILLNCILLLLVRSELLRPFFARSHLKALYFLSFRVYDSKAWWVGFLCFHFVFGKKR